MELLRTIHKQIDVVIYHYPCMDGLAAFWVARHYNFKRPIVGIPKAIDQILLDEEIYAGKNVLMVDIVTCDYLTILEKAKALVILDHHKTSQERLKTLSTAYFDMNKSGVGLAWEYFYTSNAVFPPFLAYIQERDLFSFTLPDSKEFNAGLMSYMEAHCSDIESRLCILDGLWKSQWRGENPLQEFITLGKFISASRNAINKRIADKVISYTIALPNGTSCVAAIENCSDHTLVSDLGNYIISNTPNIDCVILWRYAHGVEKYYYSLRSDDKHADVSTICVLYSGGGHRNAAGFEHVLHPKELFSYLLIKKKETQ